MGLIRINPTKILVGGDKAKAESFIGAAKSQLEILKHDMSFQNLSQGIRRVWLNGDIYVECRKNFNYQECRIWVRPVIVSVSEEAKTVYFYVRIVRSESAAPDRSEFLNKGRDDRDTTINRLILWKCRQEEKTDIYTVAPEGQQSGEYEDGTGWIITEPGGVILDVDVFSRTVYTESGGISVNNEWIEQQAAGLISEEEATDGQLKMADEYVLSIDTNEKAEIKNPIDVISQSMFKGSIYSPLAIADNCGSTFYDNFLVDPEFEATFADPVPQHWAAEDGDIKDWYHVIYNDYDLMEVDPPIRNTCSVLPETKFFETQWPKLDENKDKYLPTKRVSESVILNPGGNHTEDSTYYEVCEAGAFTMTARSYFTPGSTGIVPLHNEDFVHDILAQPRISGLYRYNSCSMRGDFEDMEHVAGNYYTSNGTYPCFFATLCGRTTPVEGTRYGGLWGVQPGTLDSHWFAVSYIKTPDFYSDDYYTVITSLPTVNYGFNKMTFETDEGVSFLSTPLEQAVYPYEFTEYVQGSTELPDWARQLLDFTGGSDGAVVIVGDSMLMWAQGAYPSIAAECAVSLNYPQNGNYLLNLAMEVTDKTEDFSSTASFVSLNGENFSSLVIFREMNLFSNWTKRSYEEPSFEQDGGKHFLVGVVFYIMYPKYDILVEGEDTFYWDIHDEREYSQDEINHNRELDLEDYVSAILVDIKSNVANIDPATGYYLPLKDKWYDMTTGFISEIEG